MIVLHCEDQDNVQHSSSVQQMPESGRWISSLRAFSQQHSSVGSMDVGKQVTRTGQV